MGINLMMIFYGCCGGILVFNGKLYLSGNLVIFGLNVVLLFVYSVVKYYLKRNIFVVNR